MLTVVVGDSIVTTECYWQAWAALRCAETKVYLARLLLGHGDRFADPRSRSVQENHT